MSGQEIRPKPLDSDFDEGVSLLHVNASGKVVPLDNAFSCNLPTPFCAKLRNYAAACMAMKLHQDGYSNQPPGDRNLQKDAAAWSDPNTHCAIHGRSKRRVDSGLIGLHVQFG
jgi:hypothetical protein